MYIKKAGFSLSIILIILIAVTLFTIAPIKTDNQKTEIKKIDTSMWTSWKTSKEFLLFKTPASWNVSQIDAGGASVITLSENQKTKLSITVLMENENAFNLKTKCKSRVVDSFYSKCFQVKENVNHYINSNLESYNLTFVVSYNASDEIDEEINTVINTINFNPNAATIAGAKVIE